MPETVTDPLLVVEHPDIKFEEWADYKALKNFTMAMHKYCGELLDSNAADDEVIREAREYFRQAFYLARSLSGMSSAVVEELDTDTQMEPYVQFMKGMWQLLENKETRSLDTPADWSLVWDLEEACSKMFSDEWTRRYHV